jgi:hypothetical protein
MFENFSKSHMPALNSHIRQFNIPAIKFPFPCVQRSSHVAKSPPTATNLNLAITTPCHHRLHVATTTDNDDHHVATSPLQPPMATNIANDPMATDRNIMGPNDASFGP